MSTIRILVVGDSHTHAIKRALKARMQAPNERVEIEAYRFSSIKNDKEIGDLSTDQILSRISMMDSQDLVVSTIGGNQHQALSLVQHPVPFEMYMPSESGPSVVQEQSIIPYAQMWDVFERGLLGRDGTRLQQIRKVARCMVAHLSPPPPKEDAAHILKRHESDFAKAGILTKGVSPAPLRLKMWRLQISVLEKLTKEWDIEFLPPPAQALDANGFLAPAYYADDATHGNASYGALLIEQISGLLASKNSAN